MTTRAPIQYLTLCTLLLGFGLGAKDDGCKIFKSDWEAVDVDGDGYTPWDGDCAETTEEYPPGSGVTGDEIYPGAEERCNGVDDDCDGDIDEDLPTHVYYQDPDRDGYGDPRTTYYSCESTPPEDYSALGGDCDEFDENVHPKACDAQEDVDDDCNGTADDEPPCDDDTGL